MSINMINKTRPFEINSSIVEWDMKRAGLNIIKELNLLPEEKIKQLEKLPKNECDQTIGKMQIEDRELSKNLESAFTDMMKKFLEENDLDMDYDVISIKKDACFVINKKISKASFGKHIRFVDKNRYHSYVYLESDFIKGMPLEFYFKRNGEVDVKNLTSNKDLRKKILIDHENGMLNFIQYTIELSEKCGLDPHTMNTFLHNFVEMYKRKELDFDYYREFNAENRFRYQHFGGEVLADKIDESMLDKVNIEYNYIHIILPLINLIV